MHPKPINRRRHSPQFRAEVLTACSEPGTSVAAIALAHGLNANLVHKWRRSQGRAIASPGPGRTSGEFLALSLMPPPEATAHRDIRIELRRGPTCVTVRWPMDGASECAIWLREWLK